MLVIAGGREARAGLDVHVGRAQDLTADRAVRLDVRDLTARVVAVENRRPGIAHGPTIAPGDHRHQRQLESHSVDFMGETLDSGVCHQAFFADPDGNLLILHNRYAPPATG